jgi:hypothetical protein
MLKGRVMRCAVQSYIPHAYISRLLPSQGKCAMLLPCTEDRNGSCRALSQTSMHTRLSLHTSSRSHTAPKVSSHLAAASKAVVACVRRPCCSASDSRPAFTLCSEALLAACGSSCGGSHPHVALPLTHNTCGPQTCTQSGHMTTILLGQLRHTVRLTAEVSTAFSPSKPRTQPCIP